MDPVMTALISKSRQPGTKEGSFMTPIRSPTQEASLAAISRLQGIPKVTSNQEATGNDLSSRKQDTVLLF